GTLLALLLFLRFDAVVAVAAAVAAVALGFVAGQRMRWLFWAPLAAGSGSCVWYLTGPMRDYFELQVVFLSNLQWWEYAAVGAAALPGVRGRLLFTRAVRGPIGVVFLALLAVYYARAAKPVIEHVEYAGIIPRLEALAARAGDDDLLIVESRDAGSDVHVLA